MAVIGQLQAPAAISPGTHWIEGCVGPGASLDVIKKRISCPCWESNHDTLVVQPIAYSLYNYVYMR
jgi:hypothetical protein